MNCSNFSAQLSTLYAVACEIRNTYTTTFVKVMKPEDIDPFIIV